MFSLLGETEAERLRVKRSSFVTGEQLCCRLMGPIRALGSMCEMNLTLLSVSAVTARSRSLWNVAVCAASSLTLRCTGSIHPGRRGSEMRLSSSSGK